MFLRNTFNSQFSVTAHVLFNPSRPPPLEVRNYLVPMRLRGNGAVPVYISNENIIKKVLRADQFEIHYLHRSNIATIVLTNTKFRSTAQAIGRIASTLQVYIR